jgi:hypothetical protein
MNMDRQMDAAIVSFHVSDVLKAAASESVTTH